MSAARVVRIYRESLPVLLVSLGGGLFAGAVLGTEGMIGGFERYPGLLLLLPAFLATRGNVYGALGAKLSSGLHQGLIETVYPPDRPLANAIVASLVNGIGISILIGLMSWSILWALGRPSAGLAELIGITLVAGLLTSTVMIAGLLLVVFGGYTYGLDPDNLIGPVVTTLGDVFGVLFLYVAITLIGVVL